MGSPSCFGVMASKGARFEGLQVSFRAPEGYRRKVVNLRSGYQNPATVPYPLGVL